MTLCARLPLCLLSVETVGAGPEEAVGGHMKVKEEEEKGEGEGEGEEKEGRGGGERWG
jgi:hypothetical protein